MTVSLLGGLQQNGVGFSSTEWFWFQLDNTCRGKRCGGPALYHIAGKCAVLHVALLGMCPKGHPRHA